MADVVAVIGAIAGVIKTAVELGPTVIKGVQDARPFAEAIYNILKGTDITQDQLNQLEEQISRLSAELQRPLPPEEE